MKCNCENCGKEYEVGSFQLDMGVCAGCTGMGARRLLYTVALVHVILIVVVTFTICPWCFPPVVPFALYCLTVIAHSLFRTLLSHWRPFRSPMASQALTTAYLLVPVYGGPLFMALFWLARILRYGAAFYWKESP